MTKSVMVFVLILVLSSVALAVGFEDGSVLPSFDSPRISLRLNIFGDVWNYFFGEKESSQKDDVKNSDGQSHGNIYSGKRCVDFGFFGSKDKCDENCMNKCTGVNWGNLNCFGCAGPEDVKCAGGTFYDKASCGYSCDGECEQVWRSKNRPCYKCNGKIVVPTPGKSKRGTDPFTTCADEGLYGDSDKCAQNCMEGRCTSIGIKGNTCYYCEGGSFNVGCPNEKGFFDNEAGCRYFCPNGCMKFWRASDRPCFICSEGGSEVPGPSGLSNETITEDGEIPNEPEEEGVITKVYEYFFGSDVEESVDVDDDEVEEDEKKEVNEGSDLTDPGTGVGIDESKDCAFPLMNYYDCFKSCSEKDEKKWCKPTPMGSTCYSCVSRLDEEKGGVGEVDGGVPGLPGETPKPAVEEGPKADDGPLFEDACAKKNMFMDKSDCSCSPNQKCVEEVIAASALGQISCWKCENKPAADLCKTLIGLFDSFADCDRACKDGECLGDHLQKWYTEKLSEPGASIENLNKLQQRKVCYYCKKSEVEDGGGIVDKPSGEDGPGVSEPPRPIECERGGMFGSEADCKSKCPANRGVYCFFQRSLVQGAQSGCWKCEREVERDNQVDCAKFAPSNHKLKLSDCRSRCPPPNYCVGESLSKLSPDAASRGAMNAEHTRCFKCVTPTGGEGKLVEETEQRVFCEDVKAQYALFSSNAACIKACSFKGACKGIQVELKDLRKILVCYGCVPFSPGETSQPGTQTGGGDARTERDTGDGEVPVEVNCAEECSRRGLSVQPPSSSGILAQLSQYRCVSGGRISLQRTSVGSCDCYGEAKVSVDTTPPSCKGTPCGDVPCDGAASCPCPDKPNCKLTVKCTWSGWKDLGNYRYQPVIGG